MKQINTSLNGPLAT